MCPRLRGNDRDEGVSVRGAAVRDRRHLVYGAYHVPPLYHEGGSSRVVKKS